MSSRDGEKWYKQNKSKTDDGQGDGRAYVGRAGVEEGKGKGKGGIVVGEEL